MTMLAQNVRTEMKPEGTEAEFTSITFRLINENTEQSEIINQLYERLNNIKQFPPEPKAEADPSKASSDFCSSMHINLGILSSNNSKLRALLHHLTIITA